MKKTKKRTPAKAKLKTAPKRTKKKARRASPKAQALPGMEQVRNTKLDQVCEAIGDTRDALNKLRRDEQDDHRIALREMHDKGVTAYRHAGVELVRVPGEERLRVRTSKEAATDITPEREVSPVPNENVTTAPSESEQETTVF